MSNTRQVNRTLLCLARLAGPCGLAQESELGEDAQQWKLLWLSCGNKDGLIRISQGVHAHLKERQVPHVWHVDGNGHDATHWKNNLWLFAQRIFK